MSWQRHRSEAASVANIAPSKSAPWPLTPAPSLTSFPTSLPIGFPSRHAQPPLLTILFSGSPQFYLGALITCADGRLFSVLLVSRIQYAPQTQFSACPRSGFMVAF
ncbi:MAG UNVERIFIED_CONTAM: hypothetical protein LVR18_37550 [Planctomycetaceae bacterium]